MDDENVLDKKLCGEEITTPVTTKRKGSRKKAKEILDGRNRRKRKNFESN